MLLNFCLSKGITASKEIKVDKIMFILKNHDDQILSNEVFWRKKVFDE